MSSTKRTPCNSHVDYLSASQLKFVQRSWRPLHTLSVSGFGEIWQNRYVLFLPAHDLRWTIQL